MAKMICPQCHYVGSPRKQKRGSGKIELLCWCMFPFGIPYSIWRFATKIPQCRHCGNTMIAPVDSPLGKQLNEQLDQELGIGLPPRFKPLEPANKPNAVLLNVNPSGPSAPAPRKPFNDPNMW